MATLAERRTMRRAALMDGTVERLAAVDDLENVIRKLEGERIAEALRASIGNPVYHLSTYPPAMIEQIAREIEGFR